MTPSHSTFRTLTSLYSTIFTAIAFCCIANVAPAATRIVELELIPSTRAPLTAAQDWARALSRLKGVRVRAGHFRAAQPSIHRSDVSVRITAVINAQNELLVPGRHFSLRQTSAIAEWIDGLRTGRPQEGAHKLDRFGLSREQLARVHAALKPTVVGPTLGKNARSVVLAITKQISLDTRMSPTVRRILGEQQVQVELQGISSGTALAVILHPMELVVVPTRAAGGRTQLVITAPGSVPEAWPVGWKPSQPVREAVPKLFEFLEIEIDKTPIAEVLAALEPRLGTPIMYDWPALELKNIDPSATNVSLPPQRTFYNKVLRQALFQARLDFEVRVDERGKPFLWITPLLRK